ncbi:MAG: hypothetical protein RLZZ401_429 [Pseudomonadota bacterium]|jgi:tripartite-type tricarboxylate transporter receptor subunit TctC
MQRRHFLSAAAAASLASHALAQVWPAKPLRLIVPFPPGGTSDVLSRALAVEVTKLLGQPILVDNKPGAGTVLGVDAVAKAAPDGYTLGCVANSFCVNQTLVKKLPYDGLKDLRPVALLGQADHVLAAPPSNGLRTLADLIAAAKKAPGQLSYASFGTGTSAHLSGAMLAQLAGISLIHVPYKGQAPAMNDLIGGQVNIMFGNWPEFRHQVAAGKLVALGMATLRRIATAPDIPTLAEQGLAMESNSWFGLLTRAGVSDETVTRLNADINRAMQGPAMLQTLAQGGMHSLIGTPEHFAEFIRSEIDKYAQVIRQAGIVSEG